MKLSIPYFQYYKFNMYMPLEMPYKKHCFQTANHLDIVAIAIYVDSFMHGEKFSVSICNQ